MSKYTHADYMYWKLMRRKEWARDTIHAGYRDRSTRFGEWTPAKPTKPIIDESTYRIIYNSDRSNTYDDVQMAWLWDQRKGWKVPNTATKTIVWRNVGWL